MDIQEHIDLIDDLRDQARDTLAEADRLDDAADRALRRLRLVRWWRLLAQRDDAYTRLRRLTAERHAETQRLALAHHDAWAAATGRSRLPA